MRILPVMAALIGLSTAFHAQSRKPIERSLAFDVATIRPIEHGRPNAIGPPVNGTVRARAIEVRRLIQYAYDIDPPLSRTPVPEGGPAWIDKDLYEVIGKGPADLTFADARRMMLTLLNERFTLQARVERRELPVYVLVRARKDGALGPGLRPSKVDCSAYSETLSRTGRSVLALAAGPSCVLVTGRDPQNRVFTRGPVTVQDMVLRIERNGWVDRPVLDGTGLTGTYDLDLLYSPARTGPGIAGAALAVAPSDELSIFTAVEQQLGLRLESRRGPVDVVVIDSVERPTPN